MLPLNTMLDMRAMVVIVKAAAATTTKRMYLWMRRLQTEIQRMNRKKDAHTKLKNKKKNK